MSKDNLVFSKKLNFLFKNVKKDNGSKYTHEDVYRSTNISVGAISKLRTGKVANPSYRVIESLASFFGVNPNYFFKGDHDVSEKLDSITFRAGELSADAQDTLLNMIEQIIQLEEKLDNR